MDEDDFPNKYGPPPRPPKAFAPTCVWCGHRSKPWLAVTMDRRGQGAWAAFMRAPSAKPQREASEKKLLNMLAGILDPTARALVQREMEELRAAREAGNL